MQLANHKEYMEVKMNKWGQVYDPSIHVGQRVELRPSLYERKVEGFVYGLVTRIAGIFAEVDLGPQKKRFHMVNLIKA